MGDKTMPVTGGCLCGAVRYEAEAFLHNASYCHCRMCQRASGAPVQVSVFIRPETLRFTSGEPKYYQSSSFGERGFCPNCGSQLIWRSRSAEHPEWTNLGVGCLDHPEHFVPASHEGVESQLPWFNIDDDLSRRRCEDDPELVAAWAAAEQGKG